MLALWPHLGLMAHLTSHHHVEVALSALQLVGEEMLDSEHIMAAVLEALAGAVEGADAYVFLLNAGGTTATCVSASPGSEMLGKSLAQGQGTSFKVCDRSSVPSFEWPSAGV